MWPIQLTFPRFIVSLILLLWLYVILFSFFTRSVQLIFSILSPHHRYLKRLLNTFKLRFCLNNNNNNYYYYYYYYYSILNVIISSNININVISKGKGKVVPLQARCGPEGSKRFRLPDFHDIRHMKVVRSSASRTGCLYPQACPGTHFH